MDEEASQLYMLLDVLVEATFPGHDKWLLTVIDSEHPPEIKLLVSDGEVESVDEILGRARRAFDAGTKLAAAAAQESIKDVK